MPLEDGRPLMALRCQTGDLYGNRGLPLAIVAIAPLVSKSSSGRNAAPSCMHLAAKTNSCPCNVLHLLGYFVVEVISAQP